MREMALLAMCAMPNLQQQIKERSLYLESITSTEYITGTREDPSIRFLFSLVAGNTRETPEIVAANAMVHSLRLHINANRVKIRFATREEAHNAVVAFHRDGERGSIS
jgi:hypothetical protein